MQKAMRRSGVAQNRIKSHRKHLRYHMSSHNEKMTDNLFGDDESAASSLSCLKLGGDADRPTFAIVAPTVKLCANL